MRKQASSVANASSRTFRWSVTRMRRAFFSRRRIAGDFPLGGSLVFSASADTLHHLHMKRIERHFSSTTDTLWLFRRSSGPEQLGQNTHTARSQSQAPRGAGRRIHFGNKQSILQETYRRLSYVSSTNRWFRINCTEAKNADFVTTSK